MNDQQEEWQWIERFRQGDEAAFASLFDKHKSAVYNLALRLVRIRETAEDIAQDVFLKLYRKQIPFVPTARFSTWLYRVTVNAALDHLKRTKHFFVSLDQSPGEGENDSRGLHEKLADPRAATAGKILDDGQRAALVRGQIDRLPQKLRLPILLYQFENMPYEEIGRVLGISVKSVERRIYHAKERLRKSLTRYLG